MVRDSSTRGVALLLGIPVDFMEFTARVSSSDWLSKFNVPDEDQSAAERAIAARWESEYLPLVAQPLRDLVAVAAGFQIAVHTRATLKSLREATTGCDTVILFAHWKGPEILSDDFIKPLLPSEFMKRVEGEQAGLGRWLLEQFRDLETPRRNFRLREYLGWVCGLPHRPKNQNIRDIFSEAIERPSGKCRVPTDEFYQVLESDVSRGSRIRDELDRMFQGLIRPGNRLELFDGLHSKEVVEAAVYEDFQGIIDLTTCTSTVLADYIARRRQQRIRTVQFPTVQEFVWAAQCVMLALRLLVEQKIPYQEARLHAANIIQCALVEMVQAEKGAKGRGKNGKS